MGSLTHIGPGWTVCPIRTLISKDGELLGKEKFYRRDATNRVVHDSVRKKMMRAVAAVNTKYSRATNVFVNLDSLFLNVTGHRDVTWYDTNPVSKTLCTYCNAAFEVYEKKSWRTSFGILRFRTDGSHTKVFPGIHSATDKDIKKAFFEICDLFPTYYVWLVPNDRGSCLTFKMVEIGTKKRSAAIQNVRRSDVKEFANKIAKKKKNRKGEYIPSRVSLPFHYCYGKDQFDVETTLYYGAIIAFLRSGDGQFADYLEAVEDFIEYKDTTKMTRLAIEPIDYHGLPVDVYVDMCSLLKAYVFYCVPEGKRKFTFYVHTNTHVSVSRGKSILNTDIILSDLVHVEEEKLPFTCDCGWSHPLITIKDQEAIDGHLDTHEPVENNNNDNNDAPKVELWNFEEISDKSDYSVWADSDTDEEWVRQLQNVSDEEPTTVTESEKVEISTSVAIIHTPQLHDIPKDVASLPGIKDLENVIRKSDLAESIKKARIEKKWKTEHSLVKQVIHELVLSTPYDIVIVAHDPSHIPEDSNVILRLKMKREFIKEQIRTQKLRVSGQKAKRLVRSWRECEGVICDDFEAYETNFIEAVTKFFG
jgi:hypothetical protein